MLKAIVMGANGLIGSSVVRKLKHNNIEVLELDRNDSDLTENCSSDPKGEKLFLKMDLASILDLPAKIVEMGWKPGNSCVFYNFAWAGSLRLADGELADQLKNVEYCANAVRAAKKIGCAKFVSVGSMEETYAEKFLSRDWVDSDYHSNQGLYAVTKLAARDMCLLVAYLEKLDFVHTRLSVPIDLNLNGSGYINSVFKQIINGEEYSKPANKQFLDIISMDDVANAYYLIGTKGKNKANYFIGTGAPKSLNEYFDIFKDVFEGKAVNNKMHDSIANKALLLDAKDFSIEELIKDTGIELNTSFERISNQILKR